MKIIVFGGSGFLGSHVADKLTEAKHQVTLFDIKSSPWLRKDQKMIVGDILDETQVARAIEGNDYVFNFAGIADIGEASAQPLPTTRYNVLGNSILLEYSRKAGVKRYIFSSSLYVYSRAGSFYRCSKQACELFIETYQQEYGLDYTILRYGSLYGPRADERNAIFRFVKQALTERRISYAGSPEALREYIHVEDAARASVEILRPEFANENIVLTGSQSMRVADVLHMISEMLGNNLKLDFNANPGSRSESVHYVTTSYAFSPKLGRKYVAPVHVDLGQGILHVIEELYGELHREGLRKTLVK